MIRFPTRAKGASVLIASLFLAASALAQAPAPARGPGGPGGAPGAFPGGPPGGAPGGAPRAGGPGRGGMFGGPVEAPVPAAVAMPRPTAAEMDAARAALPKMIEAADPATRELLKKYPKLIEVRPIQNTAIVPNLAEMFRTKHAANVEVAKKGEAELLLMGDSITDFWRNETGTMAGKSVLDKHFGQWKIANFGIAGDTTQGVLYRLNNGEGTGIKPRAIMLMIGTNNTAANTAGEIAEGVGAVVQSLQTKFPEAKILLLAIFPRGNPGDAVRDKIAEINKTIAKLHDGKTVHYLDIGAGFLDASGNIPADVMGDKLHPSTKGYEIWANAVKEPLTKLMAR